jgi:hypothetical protein
MEIALAAEVECVPAGRVGCMSGYQLIQSTRIIKTSRHKRGSGGSIEPPQRPPTDMRQPPAPQGSGKRRQARANHARVSHVDVRDRPGRAAFAVILAVVRPAFVRTVLLHEVSGPPRQRLANWRILRGTGFGQPPTKQVKEALARDQQSRNHDAGDMQCHADLYRLSPIHSCDQDLKRIVRTAVEVLDSENTLSVIGLWLSHGGKHNGVGVVVVRHMPWQRCPRSTLREWRVPTGVSGPTLSHRRSGHAAIGRAGTAGSRGPPRTGCPRSTRWVRPRGPRPQPVRRGLPTRLRRAPSRRPSGTGCRRGPGGGGGSVSPAAAAACAAFSAEKANSALTRRPTWNAGSPVTPRGSSFHPRDGKTGGLCIGSVTRH